MTPSPIQTTRGLILDMDGVLWRENSPIGDLAAIFQQINDKGLRVALATNNGTRTIQQYLDRMRGYGVELEPWQIVTSALGIAFLLSQHFPNRGDVYVIGETGVKQALAESGFSVVSEGQTNKAIAVVMGIDREVNFSKFREATLLVRRGVPFYGTNPDLTFPTPEGLIPGAGAYLALITAATDVKPIIAGKPQPYLLELARERLGTAKHETLVVGDRLETDIAGGQAAGCPTALVLSGVSTREMGEAWQPKVDIIAKDLTALIGQF
jgi:4-nitrophenyl phosphatase